MVVLKKIRASTLMETLIATVLIMVIFVVASMILNNLFSNSIKNNTRAITSKLNEIQYLYINEKIELPHFTDYKAWTISIEAGPEPKMATIKAINSRTDKVIETKILKNEG